MNRARVLFILGFLLSLSAGVVIGMVLGRTPVVAAKPAATQPHGLDEELGLNPDQKEQVHAIWNPIWASMRQLDRGRSDKRRAMSKERDEAIALLVPAERKADYDRVMQDYTAKVGDLNKERDHLMQEGEQKMKPILSDVQWKKYEDFKRDRAERGGRGGRPATMHGATRPSTRPAEREAA